MLLATIRPVGFFHRERGPRLSRYVTAQVAGKRIVCAYCGGKIYETQQLKMETTATELTGAAWAENSTALICTGCGSVQQFAGGWMQTSRIPLKDGADEEEEGVGALDLSGV